MHGRVPIHLWLLPEIGIDGIFHGSAYIRLIQPLTHPQLAKSFRVTVARDYHGEQVDAVIVERGWRADIDVLHAENLVKTVKRAGARLIYILDDNLLDPHPDLATEPQLARVRSIVRLFVREADGIIVSTEPLKSRLRQLNDRIRVVSNSLDERLFRPSVLCRRSQGKRLRLGYMGTLTHLPDLMEVLPALRAIFRTYGHRLEFELLGVSADPRLPRLLGKNVRTRLLQPPNVRYPDFLSWMTENLDWDLAIAPLVGHVFNVYKSDIKLLDYGICYIPAVYSCVCAYESSVRHHVTGCLAANRTDNWTEELSYLIEDDVARRHMGENAYEYVLGYRTLAQTASQWEETIMNLIRV